MRTKILAYALVVCAMISFAIPTTSFLLDHRISSDEYLRARVVMLESNKGLCSGAVVKAQNGYSYVLTAAHCSILLDNDGEVRGSLEDGSKVLLKALEIDKYADLMILSSTEDMEGLSLASTTTDHEKVHTMTHGHGMPSYRTDGELLAGRDIPIMESIVTSDEGAKECMSRIDRALYQGPFGIAVCAHVLHLMGMTAMIVPGSSGGPVVDSHNRLVGIVSATDGVFGYIVKLDDIKEFLARR